MDTRVTKISRIIESLPEGGPPQARYLNCVIEIQTSLSPYELLKRLQKIESDLGRVRIVKNGPRSIDLDILLYGDARIKEDSLCIPHPRMFERKFVMQPLSEIASGAVKNLKGRRPIGKQKRPRKEAIRIIQGIKDMQKIARDLKQEGKSIGFVPTMGALHTGHISLIKRARKENDFVIVSIFVNSAQFGPSEDFRRYPRNLKIDTLLCEKQGVDIIFYPRASRIYPQGYRTYVFVEKLSDALCGRFRPGHFKGVATIVTKLFNIIQPDVAYFGQKDAQQAIIIRRMTRDLDMPIQIRIMPIVRESDGLALSSRNNYLTVKQKKDAVVLYKALVKAKAMIKQGIINPTRIILAMRKLIQKKKSARIQYIEIVDLDELRPVKKVQGKVLVALVVWIGKTRLIDNVIIS